MRPEPRATYRLQLRSGFGLDQAAELVPYLLELGVSHLYISPCLQAAAGSSHGYDVVDPTRVDQTLGGDQALARLCSALQQSGLGLMVDLVPNHMAIAGGQNPWWWDVLENGQSSRYTHYFDVDWEASAQRWQNKILLPVLGDHYGRILEGGEFLLAHREGVFTLHYQEHVFPVDPSSLGGLLGRAAESSGSEFLSFLADAHSWLPRPEITDIQAKDRRHRDKRVLADLLAKHCRQTPDVAAAIDAEVKRVNQDRDALDSLIERQNYRPAFWRMENRDLGYRRFFDIKELVGVRVEDHEVFSLTHDLPASWVHKGWVHGLRIDHPDGLRDPAEYFQRLRQTCPAAWIVAEKILEPGENLRKNWPIEGTTGYDFLCLAGGLFVDPRGEPGLTRVYEDFIGERIDCQLMLRDCKRLVLTELMGSELNRLTSLFVTICEQHRRYRDYTRHELKEALAETIVCFPVYRSYVSAANRLAGQADERVVGKAVSRARKERTDLSPELFGFLRDLLLLLVPGSLEGELAMRFQQLTGPVMAKGVEDTFLYRFNRLAGLNEVGGDPGRFGVSPNRFHQALARQGEEHPLGLLASTTHDTKRSEDVRARLALLSEIPDRWAEAVFEWSELNRPRIRENGLDRNTEYLLYQTLVGAWPIETDRLQEYMLKAVREAKTRTSWTRPDEAYESGLRRFVTAIMQDERFTAGLERFVAPLVEPGRINSLAQTLVKLTAPGVPDLYQGSELWDLSLVDPDNRRPVDFALRRSLLHGIGNLSPEEILAGMDQGLPKLWVIRQALHFRSRRPDLFGPDGEYRPLSAKGQKAGHVLAFIRGGGGITLVPRLVMGLGGDWADTVLELPGGHWRNILTGEGFSGGRMQLGTLLGRFPVALLEHKE